MILPRFQSQRGVGLGFEKSKFESPLVPLEARWVTADHQVLP